MTSSRADSVSTCGNGPSLWRPRAVRQSLPAFDWAQALSRRGLWTRVLSRNDMARPCIIAHLTMPRLWVGSDRLAEFAKSKQTEGQERPTQLKRRSNMAIYPKIETRRAKPAKWWAYQHRRRRSLTGGHSVIAHGRRKEYQRSHSMFLTH